MRIERNLKALLVLFIVNLSISACSDDDLEPAGCFQDEGRRIVATITDEVGTVHEPGSLCHNIFTLKPDEKLDNHPLGLYTPCNLSDEFKVHGAKVMFSGYVYESFATEDICADFFEITEIRFINK